MINIITFLREMLPLLFKKLVNKVEQETLEGNVKIYWAGTIIRIDIKPKE